MSKAAEMLKSKISTAVIETVQRSDVDASPNAIAPIVNAVTAKIAPQIINATNQEPWYQSNVTWGSIVAIASPIVGQIVGHQFTAEEQAMVTATITAAGAAIGGAWALWGRWVAKKPLGQ
jgi:uncharacterized protein YcfJ